VSRSTLGWVGKVSIDHPRQIGPLRMGMARRSLLGAASAIVVACALVVAAAPANAQGWDSVWYQARPKPKPRPRPSAPTEQVSKAPFGQIPNGPLQIIISIDQQKLHLYSDGKEVAETLIATGVPQHPTPVGVFSIIEKDILHHSNIYSGAPMPFMQRITWSGVALHEGVNLGHPASHGCIRMPREFAARLWVLTKLGVRVIIARPELQPADFADTRLFVHMDETSPVSTGAAPAIDKPIKTAATIDGGKTSDALAPQPDDAFTHALAAKASSGGATTKMDGIASGIVLRSTIGADPPTQIAAGEPMVPSTTELPRNSELNATETPAAAPAADRSEAIRYGHPADADLDLRQRQGQENLRASGFRAVVQRTDHYRASGTAFWHARLHRDGLFGRPFELPVERRIASRRATENVAEDIAAGGGADEICQGQARGRNRRAAA
jgi:lipoprotein-anchoring transpeptidase ErfK/SrfK